MQAIAADRVPTSSICTRGSSKYLVTILILLVGETGIDFGKTNLIGCLRRCRLSLRDARRPHQHPTGVNSMRLGKALGFTVRQIRGTGYSTPRGLIFLI